MKYCKCALYMGLGAAVALLIERYGKEMVELCDKIMQKKCELIEDGLDLE